MYQNHINVSIKEAKYVLSCDSIFSHFTTKPIEANKLYLNEIIELQGYIKSISKNQLILEPGITCQLNDSLLYENIKSGDWIKVKGRCIGYDDLFSEVKLDKTFLK